MKDLDIYVTGSITRYFGIQGGYRCAVGRLRASTTTSGDLSR